MLATDAPGLIFVIVVPVLGLLAAFVIGAVVWRVLAAVSGKRS